MVTPDSEGSLPSPNLLRNPLCLSRISYTRLSRSVVSHSSEFYYLQKYNVEVLQPRNKFRFGLFPVRSSLTKGISCDLFSSGYLDISVPQVVFLRSKNGDTILFGMVSYLIRTPPDHSFLTASRRLSRSSASFFVQTSQGIHYMLEFT